MSRILCLFVFILLHLSGIGQWTVWPVSSINSAGDELLTSQFQKEFLGIKSGDEGLISDLPDGNPFSHVFRAVRVDKIRDLEPQEDVLGSFHGSIGSACYSEIDSSLWVCSTHNWDGQRGNDIKIYSFKWDGSEWVNARAFGHNIKGFATAHPWISKDGKKLIFSSDRPGGFGGMDLWYCNWLGEFWSEPINLGSAINSPYNEIFPVFWNNDIYFSSDRNFEKGLDIYRSDKMSQWSSTELLPEPFNSPQDDLLPLFIDDDRLFITSRRAGGAGGDDVYYFERTAKLRSGGPATALLECLGTPLAGAKVTIINSLDEVVLRSTSDSIGEFILDNMDLEATYRLKVEGVPPAVLKKSLLYFLDGDGNRVRVFELGSAGLFIFEYLPLDGLGLLNKMQNEDTSVLSIPISGQIYEELPGDIGKGEPVFVTDEHGELLALTFTSDQGRFKFEELRPLAKYVFRFNENRGELKMSLDSEDEDVVISVVDGVALYTRLQENEAIKLVDEHDHPIFIREDEVFIIRNIYYKFDSTNLNSVAQSQLAQLSEIMKRNAQIEISLGSHTDSRGDDDYNLKLSQRRATVAMEFLISQGVDRSAIVSQGFGETMLLNACDDQTECDERQHALNRRTEIAIHIKEEH